MKRIPISGPSISQKEIDYVTDAVTNCWYDKANLYHERFERRAGEYLGARHVVALPSCTSAIHLALAALGVGTGDEVIVPDITWIASSAPITYVGAEPVFADIDRESWCLSPESFESRITPRTKAVIVVDLYGSMPQMDEIQSIARRHGIAIVEDAAEAFGSEYGGIRAGALGDIGVFSFHGSKTITTGEGGMLATNREDLYRRVLFLRDHGREPGDITFFNRQVAFKYKMSSMQAALGLAQIERADELVAQKRRTFRCYAEHLGDVAGIRLNNEPAGTKNSYWMVTAVLDPQLGIPKERLLKEMGILGVDCRPFFHPLSSLPAYAATAAACAARQRNPIAYAISPYGINLPSGLNLSEADIGYVAWALKRVLSQSGSNARRENAA